jgi:hypothetical protein
MVERELQPNESSLIKNLSNAHVQILALVKALRNTDPRIREQALRGLENYMQPFGALVNSIIKGASDYKVNHIDIQSATDLADILDSMGKHIYADAIDNMLHTIKERAPVKTSRVHELIKLANHFDSSGFHKLADKIDNELDQSEYGFFPKERASEEEQEPDPIQLPCEGSLSTRYCPDHIGVQAARISDRTYQCPLDGRVYNYEAGYKNYQGQVVPGGNVAAQTPTTSNYGGIPMRIYDSRQSILNRVN